MSKHTSGEWTVKGPSHVARRLDLTGDYAIVADGHIIAEAFNQVDHDAFAPAEANARLIACAPELLEACKVARDVIKHAVYGGADFPEYEEICNAIAKAEGNDNA